MCRCELVTDNTNIEDLQVHFHAQSVREIRNKCFINVESILIRELKSGGVYYLSTCAKLYLEIGQNYS